MSVDVDVVVAGGGGAGLAAALRAAELGLSTVVAEARVHFRQDANTAMSTAMVPAGGTRWQAEAGVEDSPQQFLDDVMRKTKGTADSVVAPLLTSVAPDVVEWLDRTIDVPLSLATDVNYPGHSATRCHTVPDRAGHTLHGGLIDAAERHDDVTLAVPLQLTELIVEGGVVVGARLTPPGGKAEEIRSRAVVLATNGFGAAPDMIARHIPEMSDSLYFGGAGSTGDAIRLTRDLDASTTALDAYQGHGSVATPHNVLVTWTTIMHGGIMVNVNGDRFGNETMGYSEYGAMVVAQPGSEAWVIVDERIHELCAPFFDYQELDRAGAIRWANEPAELARTLGIDADGLRRSLDDAAAAANKESPDPHGRQFWEAGLSGRLAGIKVTGALFHTQGGLVVDRQARVMRGDEAISGLFAAGGAAVGMSGRGADGYLAGNGLLAALGLGFVAGSSIAGES